MKFTTTAAKFGDSIASVEALFQSSGCPKNFSNNLFQFAVLYHMAKEKI